MEVTDENLEYEKKYKEMFKNKKMEKLVKKKKIEQKKTCHRILISSKI
jgi:hypothetical protein